MKYCLNKILFGCSKINQTWILKQAIYWWRCLQQYLQISRFRFCHAEFISASTHSWILKRVQDDKRGKVSHRTYLEVQSLPRTCFGDDKKTFVPLNLRSQPVPNTVKIILSITLFLLIVCILGLPFTNWGFKTDDWGNIQHSVLKSWQQFLNLFTEGNMERFCNPSNSEPCQQAFFQGLYRPLSFVYYFVQYCIFGIQPYGFYLVTVGLHALNSVLLFLLFSQITPLTSSFFAALFFGFHPTLWNWLGWTSAQTYFIELLTLLLIVFALLAYLRSKKIIFYITACILFLLNLFLKEQSIFLPFWLIGAFYLYEKAVAAAPVPFFKTIVQSIKYSSVFWLISFFYITVRLHYFPLTNQTSTLTFQPTWHSFITRMSARLFDFVTYINDLLGLSWLPYNIRLIKGLIITTMLITIAWLWWKNTKKIYVLFAVISIPLFSWPALLMHYQPRYMYMALPWTLFIVLVLITYKKAPRIKNIFITRTTGIALALLICCNAAFLVHHLAKRQKVLHMITVAFQDLAQDPRVTNRCLYFIDLPDQWFHQGTTQAIWLLTDNDRNPIFQGSICPDEHYRTYNPLYVTWDDQQQTFRIL